MFSLPVAVAALLCICQQTSACLSYQYDCDATGYIQCIPDYEVCDGTKDCYNGNDEDNCILNTGLIVGLSVAGFIILIVLPFIVCLVVICCCVCVGEAAASGGRRTRVVTHAAPSAAPHTTVVSSNTSNMMQAPAAGGSAYAPPPYIPNPNAYQPAPYKKM
jgi:hypothetical protein